MDEFLKSKLADATNSTNEQDRNFVMDELMRNTVELEQLDKKRKSLENRRVQLILKCRSLNVSLANIGNLAGISRQRVTQILEKEERTRRISEGLRNDALVPKEESEAYKQEEWDSSEFDRLNAEYEAGLVAEQEAKAKLDELKNSE